VGVLYRILTRRLGVAAGVTGSLALACFPGFVAVSRDNGVDPLLILLMLLACAAALNGVETGRLRSMIAAGLLIALAFNTKTLAAYLVAPGIAVAYAVCAAAPLRRRVFVLLAAGAVTAVGSFAWIAFVDLTPAPGRPYVGSSTDNRELGLTFAYNGFGRVRGEIGAPGNVPTAPGGFAPRLRRPEHSRPHRQLIAAQRPVTLIRRRSPRRVLVTSIGAPGPLRLFHYQVADQGAWLLPFALTGMLAFALLVARGRRSTRRDPRLPVLLVLGGWMLSEIGILSFSKGIIHPYYVSAMAPAAAAMVAAGAVAFAEFARRRDSPVLLLPLAVGASVFVQVAILRYEDYMTWWIPGLIAAATAGLLVVAVRRAAAAAIAGLVCALLVAPAAYATTTWLAPVQGTFPAAGPHAAASPGKYGLTPAAQRVDQNLIAYVTARRPGSRWTVLTDSAPTAAPLILMGSQAGAVGGYSGTDPALDGPQLARAIARGWARYVVLGGPYSSRGGNLATKAVLHACPQVPFRLWHGPRPGPLGLALFDCAGRELALSGPRRGQ
jgi:4-amino-4-deoxy-L-arabinose transferase-like glycosyltransferase